MSRLFLLILLLAGCGSPSVSPSAVVEAPRAKAVGSTTVALRAGWTAVGFQCRRLTALEATAAGAATYAGGAYVTGPLTRESVDGLKGYWVFANSETTLAYAGEDTGQSLSLQAGWNLVSLATPDAVPGSQLVVRQNGQVVSRGSVLLSTFYVLAPDGSQSSVDVSQGGTLPPGRALWVFANAACELSWTTPAALRVTPSEFVLARYSTRQLTATAVAADGTSRDVTGEVAWTSSVPSGAAVSSTGLVTGLAAGRAQLTASLGGVHATSTVDVTDVGVPVPDLRATTTSISFAPPSAAAGQAVTFTATVTGPTPVTGGNVTFTVGPQTQANVPVSSTGQANFTTSSLPVGNHAVTVVYNPDAAHTGSNATSSYAVGLAASTTTAVANATIAAPGQTVQFLATVAGAAGTPTGNVSFAVDGGTPQTSAVNASGEAVLNVTGLSLGNHSVIATYGGSATYSTSVSTSANTSVEKIFYIAVNSQVRRYTGGGTQLAPNAFVTLGGSPYTLKTDDDGNIWAAVSNQVVKISPDGTTTSIVTGSNLRDLVVDHSGHLYYVADWITGAVLKANVDGSNVQSFASVPPATLGLEVDPSDNIYVCAYTNGEIRAFQPDGSMLTTFGVGGIVGGFNTNRWICRDAAGRFYVGSVNNDNIRSVNSAGGDDQTLVSGFDPEQMVFGPGTDLFVCNFISSVDRVTSAGVRTTFLTLPNVRALTYSR